MTPARLGFVIAVVTALVDQTTKFWAVAELVGREAIRVLPVLDLVLTYNRGISYSLFSADGLVGRLLLIGVALAALVVLVVWIARTPSLFTAAALGLIAGGAAGNVMDRARIGAVIDFLYFHTPMPLGPLSNYVFNPADAAIFLGAVGLLYESFTGGRRAADRATTP